MRPPASPRLVPPHIAVRILREGLLSESTKLLYLDTSDWWYLESGRAGGATSALRQLGSSGTVRIVVSADHLLEVGGLTNGRASRTAFMHGFPGTLLLPVSGSQILKMDAVALALHALGEDMAPRQLPCQELATLPLSEFEAMVRQTWPLRFAQTIHARATSSAIRSTPRVSKEERQASDKLQRLARKGNPTKVLEYLQRRSPQGRVGALVQSIAVEGLTSLYRWSNDRGIGSSVSNGDWLFDQYVSGALPREVSSDATLMEPVFKAWSRPDELVAVAPSLACASAVARKTGPSRDRTKIRSTETDKLHSAFAPLVDVFTCDGRIHPIIAPVLKGTQAGTVVLRSSSLQDVVEALTPS